jgi:hypothetical protein
VIGLSGDIIFDVRVNAGSDDAEEKSNGSVTLTSSDLELIFGNSVQTVGLRFINVDIPQGATIVGAHVQFKVDERTSTGTTLTIQGEAVDDAVTFSNSQNNISTRSRTTASAAWTPAPWDTIGEAGPAQQTSDISSVIQEIVSQSGWVQGNSLVLIITGTGERVAESFNGDAVGAPLLHVEYRLNEQPMD